LVADALPDMLIADKLPGHRQQGMSVNVVTTESTAFVLDSPFAD